jgi:hypothetical protein
MSFGAGAIMLISSIELNSLKSRGDSLKVSIRNLEVTEQKTVLLKDRISKIGQIRSTENSNDEINLISGLISGIQGTSYVSEVSLDSQKIDLSLVFRNSSDLSNFLKGLVSNKPFSSVVLSSFGFTPANGYILSLRLSQSAQK